jgi:hypothetical protein
MTFFPRQFSLMTDKHTGMPISKPVTRAIHHRRQCRLLISVLDSQQNIYVHVVTHSKGQQDDEHHNDASCSNETSPCAPPEWSRHCLLRPICF